MPSGYSERMAHLVLFVLASYGFWFIVTQSDVPVWSTLRQKIADRSPLFSKWVTCPVCSGFWCALAIKVAETWPIQSPVEVLLWAFAGSAAIYLAELQVTKLEQR